MDFKQNYFEIFGLPLTFEVDAGDMAARFRELQKAVHPDRFSAGTDQEKRQSMQMATLVNEAYETLRSPLRRAIYLLELKGVTIEHNPQLPPEFLMEQIELREDLESIEEDVSQDRLDAFISEVSARMKKIEAQFGSAINQDLVQAETCVYELQFLNKLLREAEQLEEKLLDY